MRMGPGTIYGSLQRMEEAGLVKELAPAQRRSPPHVRASTGRPKRARVARPNVWPRLAALVRAKRLGPRKGLTHVAAHRVVARALSAPARACIRRLPRAVWRMTSNAISPICSRSAAGSPRGRASADLFRSLTAHPRSRARRAVARTARSLLPENDP